MQSKFKIEAKEESLVQAHVLDDDEVVRGVSTLRRVFQSSLGPYGRCKLVHNGQGGHVTVTSSAGRLLQASLITNPILRLVTAGVQGHLDLWKDCGTTTATFALLIVEKALKLNVNRRLITDLIDVATDECLRYMNSDRCASKVAISLDSVHDLLSVVHGATSTKPGCMMTRADVRHIDRCIVEAFLKTVPTDESAATAAGDKDVRYLCVEGGRAVRSYVTSGTFVEIRNGEHDSSGLFRDAITIGRRSAAAVALYSVSMAGDNEDELDVHFDVSSDLDLDSSVLDEMLVAAAGLIHHGVAIVACQKVLHPRVKRRLIDAGSLVLDRLGTHRIKLLHEGVGGRVLGSFFAPTDPESFGRVESVSRENIGGRSYLRIDGVESESATTLVLYGATEESTNELRRVCATGNRVLRQTLESRVALRGSGEWQRDLARHLRGTVGDDRSRELARRLTCKESDVPTVILCVADCLDELCDTVRGRTRRRVAAGDADDDDVGNSPEPSVLDSFLPAVNAVRTAMFLAHMTLGIRHFVVDIN